MNVVILDTGCANLNSVKSAIGRHGYEPVVSRDPDVVLRADKLFLPGVGTAQAAMDQMRERELIDLIKACTQPVLGICLGMQLLGAQRREQRRRPAGHYRRRRAENDRPRPAAAAYGLEPGVCQSGRSSVSRH
jgi:imidazole glycerol phosphate synthase glutamine amidotransferase subunit